ncbi:hypothetical protein [Selenomonas ruminantium]|uniref:gp53-like domain-containing protein n=1 Tax=Selenomonas ruminantium TaxID=971 RepID=UPI0026E9787F|nr:hypothetical protein [Selenomonas ruminantium]
MDSYWLLASQGSDNNLSPKLFSDEGGYYIFPNGLIIQWGTSSLYRADVLQTITFPISFPNAVLSVSITQSLEAFSNNLNKDLVYGYDDVGTWLIQKNKFDFSWYTEAITGSNKETPVYKINYFAIGY